MGEQKPERVMGGEAIRRVSEELKQLQAERMSRTFAGMRVVLDETGTMGEDDYKVVVGRSLYNRLQGLAR